MDCFPDVVLISILELVNYKDLVNISFASTRLNKLSSYDKLWKNHCKNVWLLTEKTKDTTWKDEFIAHYNKFHNYMSCYEKVKSSWVALEKFLSEHCPEIYRTLNPGIDEEVLLKFEDSHNVTLPLDYKLSYLLRNGQTCETNQYGIFGGIFLSQEGYFGSALCKIENAIEVYSIHHEHALPITHPQSIKFGVSQLALPNDESKKHNSELIAFCNTLKQYRPIAKSFTEWFFSYVEKLTNGHYEVWQGNILLYDKDTEVSVVTNHVKVTVRWSYSRTINNALISSEIDLYTFQVRLSMADDAPKSASCKLELRHLEVHVAHDNVKMLDGNGFGCNYPVMEPGAKFTWRDSIGLKANWSGSIKGYFTMYYLHAPSHSFNVAFPELKLSHPPMDQQR